MGKTLQELTGGLISGDQATVGGIVRIGGKTYKQAADGTFDEVIEGEAAPAGKSPKALKGFVDLLRKLLGM